MPRHRPLRLRIHSWLRWLHIYTSLFSLLVVLFFAVTGITLNHPEMVFGTAESKTEVKGTLPADWKKGQEVDWFKVTEYLRKTHGVRGGVDDPRADESEGSLTFKAPGYAADCFFKQSTGEYTMTIVSHGIVAVMNDFHRGHDAGRAWAWVIDISGVLLTLVSLTGIGLLFYLKKVRTPALLTMVVGGVIVFVIMKMAA